VSITTPFSGTVCRQWAVTTMINRHTKFEVSMFTHHEDMKSDEKCIIGVVCRVNGHPWSSAT